MVQGIPDDANPETRAKFIYPDTKKWYPDKNTNEFVAAMPEWRKYGLLAFTLNFQRGSPVGYGSVPCLDSAFDEKGNLKAPHIRRLEKILDKADGRGMIVILGYFYFG